jgi:hypothetical protein
MYKLPTECPVCHEGLHAERLACYNCGTALEGQFVLQRASRLSTEEWSFVETFLKNEGKLNRVQEELDISYPTARNRLHDVIRALGYEVGEEEAEPEDVERAALLDELAEGKTTVAKVLRMLKKE